jgi:hypothetical protein
MLQPQNQPHANSPFGGTSLVIPPETTPKKQKLITWAIVAAAILLVISGGVFLAVREIFDPLRTLPVFQTDKYFSNPDSLEGASFQADLRVDADLGWQIGVGRLMAFSVMTEGGHNRLAVLIPAKIAGTLFDKNQAYRVELEIGEGGLIRAKTFKKL